jgi:glycosyltransferase involved in cell wall biosynthesis
MHSVSVILPSYNRTKFLEAALASALAQSRPALEIIIADDGSQADTRAFLRGIVRDGVRVIELPHSGNPSRVRNAAIATATGDYLAFLDSDDLWKPDKLERQTAALSAATAARWSYTACDRIDESGALEVEPRRTPGRMQDGWIFEALLRLEVTIAMPTVMAERALVVALGGFDESLPFGEFHDLCLRLALEAQAVAVAAPLSSVRSHRDHYSADRAAAFRSWTHLYEKFSRLAPEPELRQHSARMRAVTAAHHAARLAATGKASEARAALWDALPYSWSYPQWWWRSLKTLVKSAVAREHR